MPRIGVRRSPLPWFVAVAALAGSHPAVATLPPTKLSDSRRTTAIAAT